MKRLLFFLLALILSVGAASAQVTQSGSVTPGHVARWVTTGVIGDGGTSNNGSLTTVGITANSNCSFGIHEAAVSGAYHELCLGVTTSAATIGFSAQNGASALPLNIVVNGTTYTFGASPSGFVTSVTAGSGITVTGTSAVTIALASIADDTLLANVSGGAAVPSATTITSLLDNTIVSTQGAVPYRNASAWTALTPGSAGQCLISGGAAANISWGSCGGGGSGTVTSITAGTGLSGGTITVSGTIALANTAVTPAAYGSGSAIPVITIDAQGRITAASTAALTAATSITGTANQITASAATGAVTLSTPATFIAPGTISGSSVAVTGSSPPANGMYLSAASTPALSSNSTYAMSIDSSQKFFFGITTVPDTASNQYFFGSTAGGIAAHRYSNTTGGGLLVLAKSRSATLGTDTVVQSGDTLGQITATGYNGSTGYDAGGQFRFVVDGTPGVTDMPGKAIILTSPDGSATPVERMGLDSRGNVTINTGAVSTSATDGFPYIPCSAGTPVGTPTSYTGRGPIEIDCTNGLFYFHDTSAWRAALSSANAVTALSGTSNQITASAAVGAVTLSIPSGFIAPGSITATTTATATAFIPSSSGVPTNGMYLPAANNIGFATNTTYAMKIDSAQKFFFGITTVLDTSAAQYFFGSTAAPLAAYRYANSTGGAVLTLAKSRSATLGTDTIVQNGDTLGQIIATGYNGTNGYDAGAQLRFVVDGTPGASDMPGRAVILTTPDGSSTPVEAFRADKDQEIYFANIGTTASAANAFLDSGSTPANQLLRSTSSIRYKRDITPLPANDARRVLELQPVKFYSTAEYDDPSREFVGLTAEQVAAEMPQYVNYIILPSGERVPDGVQYDRIAAVALLAVVKEQERRIADLERRLVANDNVANDNSEILLKKAQ